MIKDYFIKASKIHHGFFAKSARKFNKTNLSSFFEKLEECLKRTPYSLSDIYNAHENGCTTVQSVRNAKVIAFRNLVKEELWLPYCMQLMQLVILFHQCLPFPEQN